jgi:3-phenylpropionate/cinnamic acid dioxygenase small subunit
MDAPDASVHREVENFLFDEAELLDTWRLDEWLALFTELAKLPGAIKQWIARHVAALPEKHADLQVRG